MEKRRKEFYAWTPFFFGFDSFGEDRDSRAEAGSFSPAPFLRYPFFASLFRFLKKDLLHNFTESVSFPVNASKIHEI